MALASSADAVCDLSVVILNWNTCELLRKCLQSLVCNEESVHYEVIVVDNASEDGSRQMVQQEFPQVHLIVNPRNMGFGAGNNVAIAFTRGRYVLFLNSDTRVTAGALSPLVQYADRHQDVGIMGPKLLNEDGSLQYSCRRYPNLGAGLFRNTLLGRLFPNNRYATDYLMQDWDHASIRDVDWVSGAAMMVRKHLLTQLGGFDEAFFMYCEDVDLCWRATHTPLPEEVRGALGREVGAAWRVVYHPGSVIYHYIGKSSDKVPARMTYEFHRSQYLFYRKHYRATTPFWLRPLIPLGIALRGVGTIVRFRKNYWIRRLKGLEQPKRLGRGKSA